jgi:alpha-L-rhamnosidase
VSLNLNIKNAKWIWCSDESADQHVWVYARRQFDIKNTAGAFMEICADLRYTLWVNGKMVGFGPPKYHATTPTVDRYELDGLLNVGSNVVTVLVYSLGKKINISCCMPVRGGLIGALIHADGEVLTDRTWRMRRESAYVQETAPHHDMQPPTEWFDDRHSLGCPWEPDYDDTGWAPAAELSPSSSDEQFELRDIPLFGWQAHAPDRILETGIAVFGAPPNFKDMLSLPAEIRDAQRKPASAMQIIIAPGLGGAAEQIKLDASMLPAEQGCYALWDFGRIWPGYPEIEISGTPGTVIELSYAEHLIRGHVDPTKNHLSYCDRLVLGKGVLRHRITWPKCLRYLQIEVRSGQAEIHNVWLQRSAYPVVRKGSFSSADPVLDQAWEISIHTVELCMEDSYMDTPWRERGSWLGDDLIKFQANKMVFGDLALMRRFLLHHARGQLPNGAMQGKYPANKTSHISTWTLCFAVSLLEYVETSGDVDLARELWPTVEKTLGWLNGYRTAEGLYGNLPLVITATVNIYNFIDWAPVNTLGCNSAWNAFAYRFLLAASKLANFAGNASAQAECEHKAEHLKQQFQTLFWDDQRGIFVNGRMDGKQIRRWGCQENYLAIVFGLANQTQLVKILARLKKEQLSNIFISDEKDYDEILPGYGKLPMVAIGLSQYRWPDDKMVPLGTAYFAGYALQAMCELGMIQEALDFVRSRWGEFSRQGGTTVWETWGMAVGSLSHAWSCAPVLLLGRYLLGVRRAENGPHDLDVFPQFGDVAFAQGRVVCHKGIIQVSWGAAPAAQMELVVPDGMTVLAGLPGDGPLFLNGTPAAEVEIVARYQKMYRCVRLEAGCHRLS